MTPSQPEPLTDPRFEGFTIRISPGSDPAMTRERARKALDTSLKKVVGSSSVGWTVKLVDPARPGVFDLLPPEIGELSVEDAWNVTYALQERPSVVDAEPSFEIIPDFGDVAPEETEEEAGEADAGEPPIFSKHVVDWCPRLIEAPAAWEVEPHPGGDGFPPGQRRGRGIVVGHPDSGYREHAEIRDNPNRFLDERGFDFIGDDELEEDEQGGHGLGTASVLMSSVGGPAQRFVTGVAPEASLIPYRVTRPHFGIPPPVLFRSGMLRLADAIHHAVDEDRCDVISISLGWLKNGKVEEAVNKAFEKEVIVAAAAGNRVRFFVVWPAAYEKVIACAGCTSKRRRWSSSSRGKEVDVTGPAEHIWKADIDGNGGPAVVPSSGTSFAAASVAGLAALWLARWGKQRLLSLYQGRFRLATVFRKVLLDTCDPEPEGADGEFGRGIVNARKLLQAPLPTLAELQVSEAPLFEAFGAAGAEPTAIAGWSAVASAFPNVPQPQLRSELSSLLGIPDAELDARLFGVGREVVFRILTDPALREALFSSGISPAPYAAAEGVPMAAARLRLLELPVSERLRARISAP